MELYNEILSLVLSQVIFFIQEGFSIFSEILDNGEMQASEYLKRISEGIRGCIYAG